MAPPPGRGMSDFALAAIVGGSALAGAVLGWVELRILYLLDRAATVAGPADPAFALSWTNASFPFTTVAAVVVGMGATFAILAVAVIISRQRGIERVDRERDAMTGRPSLLHPDRRPPHTHIPNSSASPNRRDEVR